MFSWSQNNFHHNFFLFSSKMLISTHKKNCNKNLFITFFSSSKNLLIWHFFHTIFVCITFFLSQHFFHHEFHFIPKKNNKILFFLINFFYLPQNYLHHKNVFNHKKMSSQKCFCHKILSSIFFSHYCHYCHYYYCKVSNVSLVL